MAGPAGDPAYYTGTYYYDYDGDPTVQNLWMYCFPPPAPPPPPPPSPAPPAPPQPAQGGGGGDGGGGGGVMQTRPGREHSFLCSLEGLAAALHEW